MQAALSRRINRLIATAETVDPAVLKSELLELAKHCQVTPGNHFLLRTVCKRMTNAVVTAFGPLSLLLVMAEPRRRQVYFAVLARLQADGALNEPGFDEAARADLLTRLVVLRNRDLVAYAYGNCPPAFMRLIAGFGECARNPERYLSLFRLLDMNPELAQPLRNACQGEPMTDDLIELMQVLPPTRLGVQVATQFVAEGQYRDFMRPYQAIMNTEQLAEEHMQRIAAGESPENLLERLYLDLPFPAPVISAPNIVHIDNGQALVRTAKEFANCLANYVAEALNNERQFYIWRPDDAPAVVFAIDSEQPFGWHLSESRRANNDRVSRRERNDLKEVLAKCGIRTCASVETSMRNYRSDVNEFLFDIDDIHDLGEAA